MNLLNEKNNKNDYANSRALYVLKIITMSFAILACVVVATAMLTRWIMDLDQKIKESNTKVAKAAARLNKFRKARIKHILKQRKLQLKQEKKNKKNRGGKDKGLAETDDGDFTDELFEEITDEDAAATDFDNDLADIMDDGE